MRRVIIVIIIFFAIASSGIAQDKVGTYNQYYTYSAQASTNGMGEVGVSFSSDNSYYFNPANLGLLAFDNKIITSGYLKKTDFIFIEMYSSHLSFPIKLSENMRLGIGYSYTKIGSDVEVTNYEYPEGTGEISFVGDYNHRLGIGLGIKKKLDIALGLGCSLIKENIFDIHNSTIAFDLGGRAGYL